jgi:Holliday junction resolvase RusA-like endonuclease
MEYNTQREHLIIPEYGRNLQKIVQVAIKTEDRDKRTQIAYLIVDIMAQLQTKVKDSPEMRHKLWDHLHIMSDFKLDVDGPYPPPDREILNKNPERLTYPKKDMRYSYYGKNIELIIEKISKSEDIENRLAVARAIANNLKKAYLTWNRDSVDDNLIKKHLDDLSHGELTLGEDEQLISTYEVVGKTNKKKPMPKKKKGKKN